MIVSLSNIILQFLPVAMGGEPDAVQASFKIVALALGFIVLVSILVVIIIAWNWRKKSRFRKIKMILNI